MSNIKKIKNINGDDIYPITVVDAIYTSDGSKLSESINELDNSIEQIYSLIDSYDKANEDLIISIKKILDDAGIEYNENESLSSLLNKVVLNTSAGGSGTVYIEGGPVTRTNSADTFNYVGGGSLAMLYVDITDLDFTPTLLVASSVDSNGVVIMTIILSYDAYYKKLTVKAEYNGNGKTGTYYSYHFLADSVVLRPDGTIRLPVPNDITLMSFNYYAVGEGKSGGSSGGGLNIISATELPAKGEENQICVITENPNQIITISPDYNDKSLLDPNEIFIYNNHSDSASFVETGGMVNSKLYIPSIFQNNQKLASYVYRNNAWEVLTRAELVCYLDGYYNEETFGALILPSSGIIMESDHIAYNGTTLSAKWTYFMSTVTTNKIDFGLYDKIHVKFDTNSPHSRDIYIAVGPGSTDSSYVNMAHYEVSGNAWSNYDKTYANTSFKGYVISANTLPNETKTHEVDIDISGFSGLYPLRIGVYSEGGFNRCSFKFRSISFV